MKLAGIEYAAAGAGPVVICLHGIGGGIDSFSSQLEGKQGLSGFRVIAVNLPGYGESDPGNWPPSFASLSQALGGFITALDVGPVHLVGQSIGGMLALEHGLRRPEQVKTLSLIGTTPSFGGRDDSFKTAFLKARLDPLDAGMSMADIAAQAAPQVVASGTSKAVVAAVAKPMAEVRATTWRGILECLVTFNRRDDLAAISQPCCLIAGGQDQNAPARTMQKMAEKLPKADYHLIETAGHMINQEATGETNQILRDFLGRHSE